MKKSGVSVSAVLLPVFFGLVIVLTIMGFALKDWRSPVASRHGAGIDAVITYVLVTTGVIFAIGHFVLAWFIWKFSRESDNQKAYKPLSRRAEWLWALIPVVIMAVVSEVGVLVMGMPVWAEIYGEVPANAVHVEVIGKQFEWMIRYPGKDGKFGKTVAELVHPTRNPIGLDKSDPAAKDDIFLRTNLRLPVNRAASIQLRSQDVLHSLAITEFRVKQDIVPGFTGHTQFVPVKTGSYEIACAELCGLGHYEMKGFVLVQEPQEFEKWLSEQVGWFE